MRRFIGMPRADDLGSARGVIPADAIDASIADRVVNRRDSIAFLDRHAGPIGFHARAERLDAPRHLVSRHHAAPPELALPHMHFGTAYVGLSHGSEQAACRSGGKIVFVEINFVGSGNEGDATFHCFAPKGGDGPGFIPDEKNVKPAILD